MSNRFLSADATLDEYGRAVARGDVKLARAKRDVLKDMARTTNYGGNKQEILAQARESKKAADYLPGLVEPRPSFGRKVATGAAGAALAGALTLGLMKLLSKNKKSDNGGESRKEVRRTTRLGPGGLAYKKGGVAKRRNKKKAVKKAVHKAVHKKAGKR